MVPAVAVIGGLGLVLGAGLGFAGKRFAVEENGMVSLIRGFLPGTNCGGCGFAGCDQLAEAIANGEAENNACPLGGETCAAGIAEVMGQEISRAVKTTAYIRCSGGLSKSAVRFNYDGLRDCRSAADLSGGPKECAYGCLGMGSCENVCAQGAIGFHDGIAAVDESICAACGKCVKACPRKLITLIPAENAFRVACNSRADGKTVRGICGAGCLACKLCEKICMYGAVSVKNHLAAINYDKCGFCGECAKKCPVKVIR